jgi:hypothetical protein
MQKKCERSGPALSEMVLKSSLERYSNSTEKGGD